MPGGVERKRFHGDLQRGSGFACVALQKMGASESWEPSFSTRSFERAQEHGDAARSVCRAHDIS
jgi:hypothetical protein